MRLSSKIKLEIEDQGKIWDLEYRIPFKADEKKFLADSKRIMKEENKKLAEHQALMKELGDTDDEAAKDAIREKVDAIDLMSVDDFEDAKAKYRIKTLVSGYDAEFTKLFDSIPNGYSLALKEIEELHKEALEKN